MKNVLLPLAALIAATATSSATLIITEIADGNRIAANGDAGTSPDPFLAFVEITNVGVAAETLSNYHINNFNNGSSTSSNGSTQLTGSLAPGETFYFAYESDPGGGSTSAFERTYGFAPNQFAGGKFVNGDDTILLFDTPYVADAVVEVANIVDTYGVLGTDGSGEVWEYLDTSAFRNPGVTSGTSTFTPSEWTFNSTNNFDGADAATHAAQTSVIPEPSVALLGALGILGLIRRRR